MRGQTWVVLVLVTLVSPRVGADDLVSDVRTLTIFADVLRRGLFGLRDEESAAFIVREPDGTCGCRLWPSSGDFRAAHYRAAMPDDVIAIVHTHPVSLPFPSPQDRVTARRLGIPIYAVTFGSIYKATADGETELIMRGARWDLTVPQESLCSPRAQPPRTLHAAE